MIATLRPCTACGLPFHLETGFYRHPLMADGYLTTCKGCVRGRVKRNYDAARPAKSAYERRRAQRSTRKVDKAAQARRYRERYPERVKARKAVSNALAAGTLTREPCVHCNTTHRVQAHHHDYSRPLDVVWACFKCHREREHGQVVIAADDGRG